MTEKTKNIEVTDNLRNDILTCRLPPGQKLPFQMLLARYGVGVSTLREGLATLVAEGLVQANLRRGFRVTNVSLEDLNDLMKTRAIIEAQTLILAIEHGDSDWEGRVVAASHVFDSAMGGDVQVDIREIMRRHVHLHATLVEACNSPRLIAICHHISNQVSRYRYILQAHLDFAYTPENHISSHAAIVESAIKRDKVNAARHMSRHSEASAVQFIELMQDFDWHDRNDEMASRFEQQAS